MLRKYQRHLLISCGSLAALVCFGLGYLSYPLLNRTAQTPTAEVVPAHQDPVDLQVFWEAWHILENDFYGEKPVTTDRLYGAIEGLTEEYGEPYTFFMRPEEGIDSRGVIDGVYGDIGADLEQTAAGFVLLPLTAQAAAQAGILAGDRLVQVDGRVITPKMSLDEVINLVRGAIDSQVRLTVERPATPWAGQLSFDLVRAAREDPTVEWHLLDAAAGNETVGYIAQDFFSARSADEMRVALAELTAAGADRMLYDLRGNRGGRVDTAVAIADMWLDKGLLLIERYPDGSEKVFTAQPGGEATMIPLTVMVDGATASAGEIVAGALQDQARAPLIGEKTYGKGSVQLVHTLTDDSSLHVTHAQWLTPNHRQINGLGLTPDVVVEAGVDPLPQALALLHQTAGRPPYAVAGRQ